MAGGGMSAPKHTPMRVTVAGAGLGGLAAAIAFARRGAQVSVYEQADAPREVGAGIQLSPNAVKALRWLEVDLALARPFRPEAAELRMHASGATVYRLPLGEAAVRRWGAPYLQVHRADIHAALLEAARSAGVALHFGRAATGYRRHEDGTVSLLTRPAAARPAPRPAPAAAEAPTEERRKRPRPPSLHPGAAAAAPLPPPEASPPVDLLIGADGVRSTLRSQMLPASMGVAFSGNVAYRGTVGAEALPKGLIRPAANVFMGPDAHVVCYPVRGGELINFVAVAERSDITPEAWSTPADRDAMRADFKGWHETVEALVEAVEDPFEWGLFGHAPLHRWHDGPVVLMGDAAHPTTPFLAQGAAMCFEDAVTLARTFSSYGMEYGAEAYRRLRFSRCTRLQQAAARNGKRFHSRSTVDRWTKTAGIKALGVFAPGIAAGLNDWIYAHDAGEAPV